MLANVTLIIPSQDAKIKLFKLLASIPNWDVIPNEIIIVDSSHKRLNLFNDFIKFAEKFDINLLTITEKNLYPGHARNIGIVNSSNDILAFLDTSTVPSNRWLSSGLKKISKGKYDGVWGKTYYLADSYASKIIRASTFGTNTSKTFPGSILYKSVFDKCGLFVESARAGEDGDWMIRAKLQRINMVYPDPNEFLEYDKLNHIDLKNLLKKWFRNYTYSSRLPHNKIQKDIYFYIFSFITIVTAYNLNSIITLLQTNTDFIVPCVTKFSIISLFILYIAVRGIILPKIKGISLLFLFPINFIFVSCLSALIDVIKVLAFGYSRFIKK